ncbi:MAG: hypothetical protein NTV49_11785, partial [Kiritimatiellaeota bacterium]|nr:hypothetical protein [Kiritimatiellota bacterium]
FIKCSYGPLWMETPEAGATLLRQAFEESCRLAQPYDHMFGAFFENCSGTPAWRPEDKDGKSAVMRRLAGDLQQSTQSIIRLMGRCIEYQWAENKAQQLRMLAEEPEALRGARGDDIIASINRCSSTQLMGFDSLGFSFLQSYTYTANQPLPVEFMSHLLDRSDSKAVRPIYAWMSRFRTSQSWIDVQAKLRPAVEKYLTRVAANARTVFEKDEAYDMANDFGRMDSGLRPPPSLIDELPLAAPYPLSDSGQLWGMFWDNGRLRLVTGSSTPCLSELAQEDTIKQQGGWPLPWNGVVPLVGNLDANADWLVICEPGGPSSRLWILDRHTGAWTSKPWGGSMPMALVGSSLWRMTAAGEISITDIKTGARELKFSHRRKDSASPLENCPPYVVTALKRYGDQHLLIDVSYQLPGYPGPKESEALFFLSVHDNNVRTLWRGKAAYLGGPWALGFNPDGLAWSSKNAPPIFAVDPWTGMETALLPPRSVQIGAPAPKAVWTVPEDLRLRWFYGGFPAYYDGQRLMFFGGTSAHFGSRCMLWVFDKGSVTGRPILLTNRAWLAAMREMFDVGHADGTLQYWNPFTTLYCPRGILLCPKSNPTNIVFIRKTDIDRYLQAHPAPSPAVPPTAAAQTAERLLPKLIK